MVPTSSTTGFERHGGFAVDRHFSGGNMAQTTVVHLSDDLDGTRIEAGMGETVTFALDGISYEIDLSEQNAQALREAMAPYVAVARRAGRNRSGRSRPTTPEDGVDPRGVREWAMRNGHEISDRGRISTAVLDAYRASTTEV